jgi:hypothetical protein
MNDRPQKNIIKKGDQGMKEIVAMAHRPNPPGIPFIPLE